MLLTLVCCELCFSAEREETGSAVLTPTHTITLEALVTDTLAKNPELNFYKAEIAAARGERRTRLRGWASHDNRPERGEG